MLAASLLTFLILAPVAPSPCTSEDGSRPGLLSVAKAEAERARQQLGDRIQEILGELEAASDPGLTFVRQRVDELALIGTAGLDHLFQSLEGVGEGGARYHRAIGAARALASIANRTKEPTIFSRLEAGLTSSDNSFLRSMATRTVGFISDPGLLGHVVVRLRDDDPYVVISAIHAMGDLGSAEAIPELSPMLESENEKHRLFTINALAKIDSPDARPHLEGLLEDPELPRESLETMISYLGRHGDVSSIEKMERFLAVGQPASVRALTLVAFKKIALRKKGRATNRVVTALKPHLKGPSFSPFVESVAFTLNELGNDSGLEKVLEEENRLIKLNPKNYRARLARANKYYRFGRYSDAVADCKEAIRHDKKEQQWIKSRRLLAACYAGQGNFRSARTTLLKCGEPPFNYLLDDFPELNEMAKNDKYRSLFEP